MVPQSSTLGCPRGRFWCLCGASSLQWVDSLAQGATFVSTRYGRVEMRFDACTRRSNIYEKSFSTRFSRDLRDRYLAKSSTWRLLDVFWAQLGTSWAQLGGNLGAVGANLGVFGANLSALGANLSALGAILGALESILGALGALLSSVGRSCLDFGAPESDFGASESRF